MTISNFTETQLEDLLHKTKFIVLESLYYEGSISEEVLADWALNKALVSKKKSFWSRLLGKKEKDTEYLTVVQNMSMAAPSELKESFLKQMREKKEKLND